MQPCRVQEIPNSLEAMQQIIGGNIEAVYPFQEPVALVCNESGKNLGLPFNRPLCDESGLPWDIIQGTFFVAGVGTEDFVSLTEDQIQRYKDLYDNMMVITAERPPAQEKPPAPTKPAKKGPSRQER